MTYKGKIKKGMPVWDLMYGQGEVIDLEHHYFDVRFPGISESAIISYSYDDLTALEMDWNGSEMIFPDNILRTLFFSIPNIEALDEPEFVPEFEEGDWVYIESIQTNYGSKWVVISEEKYEIRVSDPRHDNRPVNRFPKDRFNIYKIQK